MSLNFGISQVNDLREVYTPTVGADVVDIDAVLREVENGLPNEQDRIQDALVNVDYYHGDTEKYIDYREAESVYDHDRRPKRYTNLTRRVIEVLTSHLYNPGPRRRIEASATADRWLQAQYEENDVDALFQEADRLAHLNDVSALQVAAVGGPGAIDDPDDPESAAARPDSAVTIHLLGSEEFAVWLDPARPTRPWCVCTIARFDKRRRFQVWTRDKVWTYWSKKDDEATSGKRVAYLAPEESGANPYGVLPFAFIHYAAPTRAFWTPGPGTPLRLAHHYLDNRLCEIADSIRYYTRPQGLAYNCRPDWRPLFRPGGFTHVPTAPGASKEGKEASVEYLQAQLDIAGEWADLENYRLCVLEDHGVPRSAIRLEQVSASSGVQVVAEQWPLITRTKARQRPYRRYERDLARTALAVGGAYYGRADLKAAAAAPRLQLAWPEVEITMPGPDRDADDQKELDRKTKSAIQIVMERRGLTRDQAIAELQQVAEDDALLQEMGLVPAPVAAPAAAAAAAEAEDDPAAEDDSRGDEQDEDEDEDERND